MMATLNDEIFFLHFYKQILSLKQLEYFEILAFTRTFWDFLNEIYDCGGQICPAFPGIGTFLISCHRLDMIETSLIDYVVRLFFRPIGFSSFAHPYCSCCPVAHLSVGLYLSRLSCLT